MTKATENFERWYVAPLRLLEQMPNGDGGVIALATSCFLYERYAQAVRKPHLHSDAVIAQLSIDFGIASEVAETFWKSMRNGLLHSGMPNTDCIPHWRWQHDFWNPIEICTYEGKQELRVQPWLFMNKVLSLWRANLELLDKAGLAPWASIVEDVEVSDE